MPVHGKYEIFLFIFRITVTVELTTDGRALVYSPSSLKQTNALPPNIFNPRIVYDGRALPISPSRLKKTNGIAVQCWYDPVFYLKQSPNPSISLQKAAPSPNCPVDSKRPTACPLTVSSSPSFYFRNLLTITLTTDAPRASP